MSKSSTYGGRRWCLATCSIRDIFTFSRGLLDTGPCNAAGFAGLQTPQHENQRGRVVSIASFRKYWHLPKADHRSDPAVASGMQFARRWPEGPSTVPPLLIRVPLAGHSTWEPKDSFHPKLSIGPGTFSVLILSCMPKKAWSHATYQLET